jgi:hypothetical protein
MGRRGEARSNLLRVLHTDADVTDDGRACRARGHAADAM